MNFQAGKTFHIIIIVLLIILCLCIPKIVITPSPVSTEILYSPIVETPDICVEAPEITVTPQIECVLNNSSEQRYTEELVYIAMKNKDYPWIVQVINGKYQIFPEYQDNGIWIVTVEFQSFSRQYIFDEVNNE